MGEACRMAGEQAVSVRYDCGTCCFRVDPHCPHRGEHASATMTVLFRLLNLPTILLECRREGDAECVRRFPTKEICLRVRARSRFCLCS